MPSQSIIALRTAIESAPEMTAEHRAQLLKLIDSLEQEVAGIEAEGVENLRSAIAVAGDVMQQRVAAGEAGDDRDLAARLAELEQKAELVALEHPVIANILNAIARLG
jgi:hypothetical protein